MDKHEIRRYVRCTVTSLPADVRSKRAERLWQLIAVHPVFVAATRVLAYYALPDEISLNGLWEAFPHKQWFLPAVVGNELQLRAYQGLLQTGAFAISEPPAGTTHSTDEMDLILVPGRAFDSQGNRLGRGRGYYDCLLANYTGYTLGVCYAEQLLPALPVEPQDVKMSEVLYV